MKSSRNVRAAAAFGAVAVGLAGSAALADHAWSTYHWQTVSGVATPLVVDNTVGAWKPRVVLAVNDWNASAHIESNLTTGTTNAKRCPMSSGTIQVCSAAYGQNGWLGIATISISGGHIVAGSTKVNDTYFAFPTYNTEDWKQLVICQEIGHDYGLGHQNEDFNTDVTRSCMEYTSLPDGNTSPDQHDYDQLALIYDHGEGSTGGGGGGGPGGGKGGGGGKPLGIEPGDSPADWGRAIGKDAAGRDNEYIRNFNGYTVITHVTWVPGEQRGPRTHSGDLHFGD